MAWAPSDPDTRRAALRRAQRSGGVDTSVLPGQKATVCAERGAQCVDADCRTMLVRLRNLWRRSDSRNPGAACITMRPLAERPSARAASPDDPALGTAIQGGASRPGRQFSVTVIVASRGRLLARPRIINSSWPPGNTSYP